MSRRAALLLSLLPTLLSAQQPGEGRKLEIGFEQRVRSENWNNIIDYSDKIDDQREQIRYRTRLWMNLPVHSNVELAVGLNQETQQRLGQVNHFDEVIFENLYVDIHKLFKKGLSLRLGRQNIIRGEGFLFLDGESGDGSRAIYYNAAVLAYEKGKSKLEFMAIDNPSRDRFLPKIHNQHRLLQNFDEQAYGVYYTNKEHGRTAFESYYFYKKEIRDQLAPSNAQFQPDRHVSTAGGRVVQKLTKSMNWVSEAAYQWGAQHGGADISAWGGYSYVKHTVAHPWKPYVQAGVYAMSGSDPKDPKHIHNWDPLFARWPKWGELYVYSQLREVAIAYWTNTWLPQAEVGFTPTKRLGGRLTYFYMGAFHPFPGNAAVFGQGTSRGNNFQGRLDFLINKQLSGHVLVEDHVPGSFYTAKNNGYFVRGELIYAVKWNHLLHPHHN